MRFEKKEEYYFDTKTGLGWSLDNCDKMDWQEAIDFCQDLGDGWRFPTIEELLSLVDFTRATPVTELPFILSSYYWSNSTYATNPDCAWLIDFADGDVYYDQKIDHNYIRCVRGERT